MSTEPVSAAPERSGLSSIKIVQIGDSYSAGNGARTPSGGRSYYGPAGCYRSSDNWGQQYANSLKGEIHSVVYINKACSGAVIADITNEREYTPGFDLGGRGRASCPSAEYPEEERWTREDIVLGVDCDRFLKPQIDWVDETADIVLLTAGGNDVNFSKIIQECIFAATRDPGSCRGKVNEAETALPGLEEDLFNTLILLKGKMKPEAKIVLPTYPYLIDDVGYVLTFRSLFNSDRYNAGDEMRRIALEGDNRQRSAVQRVNEQLGYEGVVLVDGTKELFDGSAPNPFAGEAENPDRWLHAFETRITNEWYHPNSRGQAGLASLVQQRGTFGLEEQEPKRNDVDLVFVVDTSGSMSTTLRGVQERIESQIEQVAASSNSYRVAVVSYRDFPERTGYDGDYPSRVDQPFTTDRFLISEAVNSLEADGGGDLPESVYSGINTALDLPWRPGVTKSIIVIGDAPALSPEPFTDLTAIDLARKSLAIDPVQVFGIDEGTLNEGGFETLPEATGGEIMSGATEDIIPEIIDEISDQPFAWMGESYVQVTGQEIEFDASGSYQSSGNPISLYEWDFEGDGIIDAETTTPTVDHTYEGEFEGVATVRVTGDNGQALGSTRVTVNDESSTSQGDQELCEKDEDGLSILFDEDGNPLLCTANNPPTEEREGVEAIVTKDPVSVVCPSASFDGVRLIGESGRDVSDAVPVDLADGTYSVELVSADERHAGSSVSQTEESWFVEGLDEDGEVVFVSDATPDLADGDTEKPFTVGEYEINNVVAVRAQHASVGNGPNSIEPAKVTFKNSECTQ